MIEPAPPRTDFEQVENLSRVGFFDYDPKTNHTFWDKYMHEICGLEEGSDVDKNEYFFSLVHPDDKKRALKNFQTNNAPGSENVNFKDQFRLIVDGKELVVSITGVIFKNENLEVLRNLGIVNDITKSLETQAALRESEEKMRSILDYTPDNIFSVDLDYKISYINRVAPGLTREGVIGTSVVQLVTEEDREMVKALLDKVVSEGTEEGFFTKYYGPNGIVVNYSSKVTPIFNEEKVVGATFISRDVTDQEETRSKLAESEYRFRTLVESSIDNIFTVDREWTINFINRIGSEFKREDVVGKKITDFLLPQDKEPVTKKLYEVFTKNVSAEYNTVFEYSKGRIHYSTKVSPLSEDGEVYGAVFISRDITSYTRQSEKLKEQSKELQRINQNLEQLAYVSSHDMKAPVANLKSLVRLLEEEEAISEGGLPIFEKMKKAIDQMNHTIVTLNEVFAVQSNLDLKREMTHIEEIYDDVYNSIENQITESNATVKTQFDLKKLEFPSVHLISIIQNLITNSIKYKHPDRKPEIMIKSYKEEGYSWLEVKDNGRGIDLEKYGSKVFGLFQRFDLSTEGKGIGLHIIKSIVENYGGEVMLRSKPNDGTTFIIRLD